MAKRKTTPAERAVLEHLLGDRLLVRLEAHCADHGDSPIDVLADAVLFHLEEKAEADQRLVDNVAALIDACRGQA